jgi:hypothetical protein
MATLLDQEQIEQYTAIAGRLQKAATMADRPGTEVAEELGGRYLVRYLTAAQLTEFTAGSTDRAHWVTTTAIAPDQVVAWLALFAPKVPRAHALILDAAQIAVIRGPAWIRLGKGIEYYLPQGFPEAAVVDVGVIQVT